MPVTSGQSAPAVASAARRRPSTPSTISSASCSTRPGAGNALATGRRATATGSSPASNTTHRLDELPWSTARITAGIDVSPEGSSGLRCGRPGGGRQDLPDLAADRRSAGQPALEDGTADGEPPRAGRVEGGDLLHPGNPPPCHHCPPLAPP